MGVSSPSTKWVYAAYPYPLDYVKNVNISLCLGDGSLRHSFAVYFFFHNSEGKKILQIDKSSESRKKDVWAK